MENTPITLENILEQAPNWTFAGDFTLLQWMNKISQDLESRANKTTEALIKLDSNVRSTNIALDNVANSLTTLQFGNQFVESRVQDDETLANANESISKESNKYEVGPSSKDMLNTFLNNNLKILRNCHEKYSLDLDDSDDDEESPNEKTCIYQPINPYNERPLPFIFGSKDWHAKWHVGLCENQQDNNYSGDEISETFSVSSNSPTDGNESFESNTEWASSNSVDNNNYNANIKIRNASSLRCSQQLLPGTPSTAINVQKTIITTSESSSVSTPSSSLAKKSIKTQKQHEIKPTRSESINSINSTASNRNSTTTQAITKEKSLGYSKPAPPFVDLFAEPPEDMESIKSTLSSTQHTQRQSVDFTTSISSLEKSFPTERPTLFNSIPPPFVDLFSEPPEDIPSTTSSVSLARNIKRKSINLFDDDNNIESEGDLLPRRTENEIIVKPKKPDDLLATQTQKKETEKSETAGQGFMKPKNIAKDKPLNVSITPKSLFDEDDDENDDDFLKAFAKKSSLTKSPLTKTLLFDNDYDLKSESPKKASNTNIFKNDFLSNEDSFKTAKFKEVKTKKVNIFDDIDDDEDENSLFRTKNKSTQLFTTESIKPSTNPLNESKVRDELEKKSHQTPENSRDNLFDDPADDMSKDDEKQKEKFADPAKKKINLFDDLEDDDNDLFSTRSKPLYSERANSNFKQTGLITSGSETANDSKSLTNKINSQEISAKANEATEKDLNFNVKEILSNENNNDTNLSKTMLKSAEAISEFKTTEQEKELYLKTDRARDNSRDRANKSIQKLPETETATNIETVSLPQKEVLKENINDKLKNELENKELNNNNIATDFKTNPEVLTTNILLQNESSASTTSVLHNEICETAKETESSAAPSKYDFNSIMFLDEPPEDDSEFFETLAKTPKTLNSKYNSIDLEHDLYEPDLPTVPSTNTTINPVDSADNRQPTSYTGLQLFSDVPPDDDDNDNAKSFASDSSLTKRLHSVFYDDFNETLAALNMNQDESISSPKKPPLLKNVNINRELLDYRLADAKEELFVENTDSKSSLVSTNKIRSVSKLQMPNININVQALLPGSKVSKLKEDRKYMPEPESETETKTVSNINQINVIKGKELSSITEMISKKETVTVARTAETEHILPNVTKNRVRAPTTRRPSTRKARQDNYRKSLMEEAEQQISTTSNEPINKTTLEKEKTNVAKQPATVEQLKEKSFLNEKENTGSIKTVTDKHIKANTPITSIVSQSYTLNEELEGQVYKNTIATKQPTKDQFINKTETKVSPKRILAHENKIPSTSTLFDDELEDDSIPFDLSPAPKLPKDNIQTGASGKNIKKPTKSLIFDDDDEIHDSALFNISQAPPKDKIQTQSLENSFVEKKNSSLLFDDDEVEANITEFRKNNKSTKTKNSVAATKKEEKSLNQPSLKEKPKNLDEANISAKPTGSLLFDDENEDDDDFLKRFKSKDTKKATNFIKVASAQSINKTPSDATKILLEKEHIEPASETDYLKQTQPLQSTVVTQHTLSAEVEVHTTVALPNITSNISNLLPAKDSLSLEDENEKPISTLEATTEQIKQNKNSGNFLDDDYDDDNLFGTSYKTKSSDIKPQKTKIENTMKAAATLTNDNNGFVQTQIPVTKNMDASKRNVSNNKKDKFISFLDSESDDDFTVAGLQTKKSTQSTKPTPAPTTSSKTSTKHKVNKSNSTKLFADSDTDSDDLFGKITPNKTLTKSITPSKVSTNSPAQLTAQSLRTKPQISLFNDESDEGVDFLKSSGSATKKVMPKSAAKENRSKVTTQSNASLFSDIESDEDDLFGGVGVIKPSTASIIPKVKTPATSQPVAKTIQTSKANTSADNPLADLL